MSAAAPPTASAIDLPQPYLLFLGDTVDLTFAKTAIGLRDWAPERCLGEFALSGALTIGLPRMRPAEAHAAGARALVIGVANFGGVIKDNWIPALVEALEAGLDIISGMHGRLADCPEIAEAADRFGRQLIEIRRPPANIPVGKGVRRPGKRLLTVGTDCALGKKYTALAIARSFRARGVDVDFRATGQTGILIAGGGMPMDAVISDFEAGAAELVSPAADPAHWDVIEGQGSLFHPAYAAVSLGLLHGSQPDLFVVCHRPDRTHIDGYPDFPIPSIEEVIELTVALGRRTNPGIRCSGISLNTAHLQPEEAERLMASEADRLGLPVADPVRGGPAFDRLVDAALAALP